MFEISVVSELNKTCEITYFQKSGVTNLVIPDEIDGYRVIGIQHGAFEFKYKRDFITIKLPKYLKYIGENVFSYGEKLTHVDIPKSVREIRQFAFYECPQLEPFDIPESIENIDISALPEQMIDQAESDGGLLYYKNILLGNRLQSNVQEITIRDGTTLIAAEAFKDSLITSVVLPDTLKYICNSAFTNCFRLKKISFSGQLEQIACNSFSNTPIQIKSIKHYRAFYLNNALVSVADDVIRFKIKQGTTILSDLAFAHKSQLKSVVIPEGVVFLSKMAFYNCEQLEKVQLPNTLISIGRGCFHHCRNLKEISLPKNLAIIQEEAFAACGNLSDITFNDKLLFIQREVFTACNCLTNLKLPESIKEISEKAFDSCARLTKVDTYEDTYFDKNAFGEYCVGLSELILHEPKSTTCYQVDNNSITELLTTEKGEE